MATPIVDVGTIGPVAVAGSTGLTTLATGVTGFKHVLLAAHFGAATATGFISFLSATSTALTASMRHKVAAHFTMPYNPMGWVTSASGAAMTLKVTTAGCKAKGVVSIGRVPA